MIKILLGILLFTGPSFSEEASKAVPPPAPQRQVQPPQLRPEEPSKPVEAPKAEPPKPTEIQVPLTPQEQLEIRLQLAKEQEAAIKKQLKVINKNRKSSFAKTLDKIRKAHGWDDSIQIRDNGQQVVGIVKP